LGAAPDRDGSGTPLPDRSDEGRDCGEHFQDGVQPNSDANKKRAARTGLAWPVTAQVIASVSVDLTPRWGLAGLAQ
jgi:hypothetical protein